MMNKTIVKELLISLVIIGLIISCDTPRDNPFDPNSDLYVPSQAPATVSALNADSLTDKMVNLSWISPQRAYEYSLYYGDGDWDGDEVTKAEIYQGELPGVLPAGTMQSIWITLPSEESLSIWSMFSKSESGLLSSGSDTIHIITGKWDNIAEISAKVRTIRIARWGFLFDLISLDVVAEINDPDGIDTVSLFSDSVWLGNLTLRNGGVEWGREFFERDLPGESVEAIIGHDLIIQTYDLNGFVSLSDSISMVRIIDLAPEVANTEEVIVSPTPLLIWEQYNVEFVFTYSLQIIYRSGSGVLTDYISISGIYPDSTSYQITENLPVNLSNEDYYLWTIAVIDEFGNEARSKQAKFTVIE